MARRVPSDLVGRLRSKGYSIADARRVLRDVVEVVESAILAKELARLPKLGKLWAYRGIRGWRITFRSTRFAKNRLLEQMAGDDEQSVFDR